MQRNVCEGHMAIRFYKSCDDSFAEKDECSDHRTISLISHASKILLKILTNRSEAKARDFIGRNQFEFRKGCGTRDAIGVMRMICERSLEFGNNIYICSVDFEKHLIE